jgi:hypothetical protein
MAVRSMWRNRWGKVVVIVSALWLASSSVMIHPHGMAYANILSGGPAGLWRNLADSNVDWGQDLPALAEEVGKSPVKRIYLGYFGTADPAAYGLDRYHWIPSFGMAPKRFADADEQEGREWIAISITNLLEVYSTGHEDYGWLRERPFTAFPGYSIALFDITDDADSHRRIGETAMAYGETAAAVHPLRRAVELNSGDEDAHRELILALYNLGSVSEALTQCDVAGTYVGDSDSLADLCGAVRGNSVPAEAR